MEDSNEIPASSSNTTRTTRNRRTVPAHVLERQRAVADREASRLARPESSKVGTSSSSSAKRKGGIVISSTPFGSIRSTTTNNNSNNHHHQQQRQEEEEWCGPFSVARQLISKREEVRRKREEEQAGSNNGNAAPHPLDDLIRENELERKRKENPSMMWKPSSITTLQMKESDGKEQNLYAKRRRRYQRQKQNMPSTSTSSSSVSASTSPYFGGKINGVFPSLSQLCINMIVSNFESVDSLGLYAHDAIRKDLVESLIANDKFNGAAFEIIVEAGMEALELMDCTTVTQDQMADALGELIPSGLKLLAINHCGRCFGKKAIDAITKYGKNNEDDKASNQISLLAVSIGGAYVLKDEDMARMVRASYQTLASIELKACPLIGTEFCNALASSYDTINYEMSTNGRLLELSLENTQLTKEQLLSIQKSLRHIKTLSIHHMDSLDDEVLSTFLLTTQGNLERLAISHNSNLTDQALLSMRQCNSEGRLKALELSNLNNITAVGLEAFFTWDIPDVPSPPCLKKLNLSKCGAGGGDAVNNTVMELALLASSRKRNGGDPFNDPSRKVDSQTDIEMSTMGGLVSLDVSNSSITDKTIEHIATTCSSSLVELHMNFCPHVSDKGLGYLVDSVGNQWKRLHIWGCAQLTDEFLDGHSRVEDEGNDLEIMGAWMKQSGKRSMR